ncbi:MAG: hypothetical protein NT099_02600 [Candidatus Saganbacteria bacterium]|nr:hypothetical protein [Candidatus Saganbacteria bacterium]
MPGGEPIELGKQGVGAREYARKGYEKGKQGARKAWTEIKGGFQNPAYMPAIRTRTVPIYNLALAGGLTGSHVQEQYNCYGTASRWMGATAGRLWNGAMMMATTGGPGGPGTMGGNTGMGGSGQAPAPDKQQEHFDRVQELMRKFEGNWTDSLKYRYALIFGGIGSVVGIALKMMTMVPIKSISSYAIEGVLVGGVAGAVIALVLILLAKGGGRIARGGLSAIQQEAQQLDKDRQKALEAIAAERAKESASYYTGKKGHRIEKASERYGLLQMVFRNGVLRTDRETNNQLWDDIEAFTALEEALDVDAFLDQTDGVSQKDQAKELKERIDAFLTGNDAYFNLNDDTKGSKTNLTDTSARLGRLITAAEGVETLRTLAGQMESDALRINPAIDTLDAAGTLLFTGEVGEVTIAGITKRAAKLIADVRATGLVLDATLDAFESRIRNMGKRRLGELIAVLETNSPTVAEEFKRHLAQGENPAIFGAETIRELTEAKDPKDAAERKMAAALTGIQEFADDAMATIPADRLADAQAAFRAATDALREAKDAGVEKAKRNTLQEAVRNTSPKIKAAEKAEAKATADQEVVDRIAIIERVLDPTNPFDLSAAIALRDSGFKPKDVADKKDLVDKEQALKDKIDDVERTNAAAATQAAADQEVIDRIAEIDWVLNPTRTFDLVEARMVRDDIFTPKDVADKKDLVDKEKALIDKITEVERTNAAAAEKVTADQEVVDRIALIDRALDPTNPFDLTAAIDLRNNVFTPKDIADKKDLVDKEKALKDTIDDVERTNAAAATQAAADQEVVDRIALIDRALDPTNPFDLTAAIDLRNAGFTPKAIADQKDLEQKEQALKDKIDDVEEANRQAARVAEEAARAAAAQPKPAPEDPAVTAQKEAALRLLAKMKAGRSGGTPTGFPPGLTLEASKAVLIQDIHDKQAEIQEAEEMLANSALASLHADIRSNIVKTYLALFAEEKAAQEGAQAIPVPENADTADAHDALRGASYMLELVLRHASGDIENLEAALPAAAAELGAPILSMEDLHGTCFQKAAAETSLNLYLISSMLSGAARVDGALALAFLDTLIGVSVETSPLNQKAQEAKAALTPPVPEEPETVETVEGVFIDDGVPPVSLTGTTAATPLSTAAQTLQEVVVLLQSAEAEMRAAADDFLGKRVNGAESKAAVATQKREAVEKEITEVGKRIDEEKARIEKAPDHTVAGTPAYTYLKALEAAQATVDTRRAAIAARLEEIEAGLLDVAPSSAPMTAPAGSGPAELRTWAKRLSTEASERKDRRAALEAEKSGLLGELDGLPARLESLFAEADSAYQGNLAAYTGAAGREQKTQEDLLPGKKQNLGRAKGAETHAARKVKAERDHLVATKVEASGVPIPAYAAIDIILGFLPADEAASIRNAIIGPVAIDPATISRSLSVGRRMLQDAQAGILVAADNLLGGKLRGVKERQQSTQQELEGLSRTIEEKRRDIETLNTTLETVTKPALAEELEQASRALVQELEQRTVALRGELAGLQATGDKDSEKLAGMRRRREIEREIGKIEEEIGERFTVEERRITTAKAEKEREVADRVRDLGEEIAGLEGKRPGISERQNALGPQESALDAQLRTIAQKAQEALDAFQALAAQFKGMQEAEHLASAGAQAAAATFAALAEGPGARNVTPETSGLGTGGATVVAADAVAGTGRGEGDQARHEGPAEVARVTLDRALEESGAAGTVPVTPPAREEDALRTDAGGSAVELELRRGLPRHSRPVTSFLTADEQAMLSGLGKGKKATVAATTAPAPAEQVEAPTPAAAPIATAVAEPEPVAVAAPAPLSAKDAAVAGMRNAIAASRAALKKVAGTDPANA